MQVAHLLPKKLDLHLHTPVEVHDEERDPNSSQSQAGNKFQRDIHIIYLLKNIMTHTDMYNKYKLGSHISQLCK